jgi:hypothetical protein
LNELASILRGGSICETEGKGPYITKSIPPSSFTHLSTALSILCIFLTSTFPIPITFDPARAVSMDFAIDSVLAALRPMMHAFAPRWTMARTWAEQIVPAPPVQKTTLLSGG